jgi:hypothetical protein
MAALKERVGGKAILSQRGQPGPHLTHGTAAEAHNLRQVSPSGLPGAGLLSHRTAPPTQVLTHCLLDRPIEIRTHAFEELAIDEREEYVNLLSALRESCDRGQRSAHNFVGVLLSNKKNKFMV